MKTILVPIDLSTDATDTLFTAAAVARKAGGIVMLLHNIETLVTNWPGLSENEKQKYPGLERYQNHIHRKFDEIVQDENFEGLQVQRLITFGVTSDEIIKSSIEFDADLVIMCSGNNSIEGPDFIGSTLQKVVRQAACPILALKKEISFHKWTKALIPVSLDFNIDEPFREIVNILSQFGSIIQLLYVNTPQSFKDTATIYDQMNNLMVQYPSLKFETDIYDCTEIEKGILEFAESAKSDCIAMITYEHKHAPSYQLSVTDHILYHANVPVLAAYENFGEIRTLHRVSHMPSFNV